MIKLLFPFLMMFATLGLPNRSVGADRPNVVVILTDDQGWGDLSIHGNRNLKTPRIDSIGRQGALFERFYVQPVCSPTRAEFLTGRHHFRGGVSGVSQGLERLDLDEQTIADVFRSAGYATGAFGKWHNGLQYPYHPNGRGFQEYYGFCSGHWGDYFSPPLDHNGKPVTGDGYTTDDFTNRAMSFIETHHREKRPFFCYVPLNTPHSPMQVPDRFYEPWKDRKLVQKHEGLPREQEDEAMTRAALAMCENIDFNVGRLLDKLDQLQIADNTIVLFFCDNGPNSFRWNGGLRGRKGSTDEGGTRSPLLIRWPGHIAAGSKIPTVSAAIDLLPTLTELAGVALTPRPNKPLDGVSQAPLLLGKTQPDLKNDRMIWSFWANQISVRTNQFSLDTQNRLYDLTQDQGQRHNIAKQHPDVLDRFMTAVAEMKQVMAKEKSPEPQPFPVGHPEFPVTVLPARDGVPHGNIQRSAKAPNCSFFTNWKSTDDKITWNVQVNTPGKYEAVVYYTCSKANTGAVIQLKLNQSQIEAIVTDAHDPPLKGTEHDRVNRDSESYVKDFKPMKLGIIDLKAEKGSLTLQAQKVIGDSVIDVRSVVLTLLP